MNIQWSTTLANFRQQEGIVARELPFKAVLKYLNSNQALGLFSQVWELITPFLLCTKKTSEDCMIRTGWGEGAYLKIENLTIVPIYGDETAFWLLTFLRRLAAWARRLRSAAPALEAAMAAQYSASRSPSRISAEQLLRCRHASSAFTPSGGEQLNNWQSLQSSQRF